MMRATVTVGDAMGMKATRKIKKNVGSACT